MTGVLAPFGAAAQAVAEFYQGKQVRMIIRANPGGNSDQYSRLLARHMGRYLPGNPTFVPVNMPGGGGLTALNYIANVAPRDGTILTMLTQTLPMEQALELNKNLNVDMRRFGWIGNMSDSSMMLLTSRRSGIKSLDDATRREVLLASPGDADPAKFIVALCNKFLKTRFKLIYGYPGGVELTMAVLRGETDGRATADPRIMFGLADGGAEAFHLLVQVGMRKQAGFTEVPLLLDLARNPDERAVFEYISKVMSLSRIVCTNADVPADRLAALRHAFNQVLVDGEFLAEARKARMEIEPMNGEGVQKYVSDLIEAPPALLERVKSALGLG